MCFADTVSSYPIVIRRSRQSTASILPLSHFYQHKAETFPRAPIYGGSKQVKSVTKVVKDTDAFTIGSLEVK